MLELQQAEGQAKPKTVLQLVKVKNKSNQEVIEVLELLLEEAMIGNLTGIAGVFEMLKKRGEFCYGTCGENTSSTLISLNKLVDTLQY